MAVQISIRDNPERHRFEVDLGGGSFAFADYLLRDGKIVFTHTQVPPGHEGHGIGTAIVRAGLEAARERGLKVVPACPFFAAYMRNHADEQDLLDPESKIRLDI